MYFCPNCMLVERIDLDSKCCDYCNADVCHYDKFIAVAKEILCVDARDREITNLQLRVKKLEDQLWDSQMRSRNSSESGW